MPVVRAARRLAHTAVPVRPLVAALWLLALLAPAVLPAGTAGAAAAPANDLFSSAAALGTSAAVSGSTAGATLQSGEPRPCGSIGSTVWYRLTSSAAGTLTVSTSGSGFDTVVALYRGDTLSSLAALACNDDYAGTLQSQVSAAVDAGTTYYLQLGGYSSATGAFTLRTSLAASATAPTATPTPTATRTPTRTPTPTATPAATATRTPTPAPQSGTSPGVNRGFDAVDFSAGPGATLEKAAQAGFPWVKGWLSWRRLEESPGVYAWETGANDLDNILAGAGAHGLTLLLRVDEPPYWATSDGSGRPYAVDEAALRRFMTALSAHAGARAGGYEIFNEPNLYGEWGQPVDAAGAGKYASLVRAAREGVQAGYPAARVVSAGLASNAGGGPGSMDDLDYLRAFYAAGARGGTHFDALGSHPYGGNTAPSQDPLDCGGICFRRAELQRQVMLDNGDSGTPVWATEIGWLHDTSYDLGGYNWMKVTAQQQADFLAGAYRYAEQYWPWMGPMFVFNLDYSTAKWCGGSDGLCYPQSSAFYWFSVLNDDRSARPAYTALAALGAPLPLATATPSPTATRTPTATATATATGTATAAATGSPTPTATPTGTATATPTATATGTAAASVTATATGTLAASATPTPTPTATGAPAVTATPEGTAVSPTATATAAPEATATPTATVTPSVTPTATPSATATATVTAAATITATATVTATPAAAPTPAVPSGLTAEGRNNVVRLSWTASSTGGVTYTLYRGTAPSALSVYATGLTGTRYDDRAVVSGQTYYYQVTANNAAGESPRSNQASARAR